MRNLYIRRGLFRVWIVFAVLWCLVVGSIGGAITYQEFDDAANKNEFISKNSSKSQTEPSTTVLMTQKLTLDAREKIIKEMDAKGVFNEQEKQIIILGMELGKSADEVKLAIARYRAGITTPATTPVEKTTNYLWQTYLIYTLLAVVLVPSGVLALVIVGTRVSIWVYKGFRRND